MIVVNEASELDDWLAMMRGLEVSALLNSIPRSTRDADFVVELPAGSLQRLAEALAPGLTLSLQSAFEGGVHSPALNAHHFPTMCCGSLLFSSQMYSINSVSGCRTAGSVTVHGRV